MVSGPTNDPEVFSEISGVNLLIEEPGSLSAPNSFASREDESELTNSLHQFWEIESMGTKEEQIAKEEFLQDIQYQESEGQYEVNLPWKTYCTPKSDSYVICVKRLRQLWSRLKNDKWLLEEYDKIIKEQEKMGIDPVVESAEISHFLPHHGCHCIRAGRSNSMVKQLRLFLDQDNIICCEGRISSSTMPDTAKQPILLPSKHDFTKLVIYESHKMVHHDGIRETLNFV